MQNGGAIFNTYLLMRVSTFCTLIDKPPAEEAPMLSTGFP